jgi:hypothetical protein
MNSLVSINTNLNTNNNTNKLDNLMELLNTAINNNNNSNYTNFSLFSVDNIINENKNEKFHEIFNNKEISIGFTLYKLQDESINSNFYISNLLNKNLTDVKINFMVQRFVTLKVISTSGNKLEPLENKGIKKVILIFILIIIFILI